MNGFLHSVIAEAAESEAEAHVHLSERQPESIEGSGGNGRAYLELTLAKETDKQPSGGEALIDLLGEVGGDSAGLSQLVAMGFAKNQAKEALVAVGGNLDQAVDVLSGAVVDGIGSGAARDDSEAVAKLVAMGFVQDQAKEALAAVGGDLDGALGILLS